MSFLENIPKAVTLKLVHSMINNYDERGIYYGESQIFITETLGENNSISSFIKEYLIQKLDPIRNERDEVDHWINEKSIYDKVSTEILNIAKQKIQERALLRIEAGGFVDFATCTETYSYLDKIFFRKDGGWGIANNNGLVIIKNEYKKKFTLCVKSVLINSVHHERWMVQNVDNNLYGIIDPVSFQIILPCIYDKIVIEKIFQTNDKEFDWFKVTRNFLCGYYDCDGKQIVACKYKSLATPYYRDYIECGRDGESQQDGYKYPKQKYDLYDLNGDLLIGGYDYMEDNIDFYKFYFGTSNEENRISFFPSNNENAELGPNGVNYDKAICLVLDHSLRPLLNKNKYAKFQKGIVFESKEDVIQTIPSDLILNNRVFISLPFIFSTLENGEQHIITTPQLSQEELEQKLEEAKDRQKLINLAKAQMNMQIDGTQSTPDDQFIDSDTKDYSILNIFTEDVFLEDDLVTVIKLSECNHHVVWQRTINEFGYTEDGILLYRTGEKCGFLSKVGFDTAKYTAIATDYNDGKIYVAIANYCVNDNHFYKPNFIRHKKCLMEYYELTHDGILIKFDNDWSCFNPLKHRWFPRKFLEDNDIKENPVLDSYSDSKASMGTEWTEEDSWDALTDGMYGPMPRNPMEYDAMMDAMGF